MILHTLRLSNYKQYARLDLEFREGLVGIIGKNGAGKSTLFEAILYCLFGRDEGNKAHVRSAFADQKATVELELTFSIGEIAYRVRREFRGKSLAVGAEFYKNDLLIAKGVSPVNDELVKVLHLERDAFKRSVFSGQKELSELSDTSGEARKRMVRRMLGLDTLDEMQSRVNADLRDLSSQAAGQRQNLLDEQAVENIRLEMAEQEKAMEINKLEVKNAALALEEINAKHRVEKEKFDKEEARFKQYSSLQNELAQAVERHSGLKAQMANLIQKEAELRLQQSEIEQKRAGFAGFEAARKELETLENERMRHINKEARLAKINETREQLQMCLGKLEEMTHLLSDREKVASTLAEKQKTIERLEGEMDVRRTELRQVDQQIGGIQAGLLERNTKLANLRTLGKEGNCPTCFQPLLEGYERALTELENEIKALEVKELQDLEVRKKKITEIGIALKNEQTVIRAEADKLLQSHTRLAETERQFAVETNQRRHLEERLAADERILREIGEVRFDEADYMGKKSALAAQEPLYRAFLAQENYVAREMPATQESIKTTESAIHNAGQRIEALKNQLAVLAYDEAAYRQAKQAVADFSEAFQAQTEVLRTTEKKSIELQNEQSKAVEKLRANERILAQISDKLEEVELLRKLTEMLGVFKTEILEKVSPGISREASELFSRITKGKYEGIRVDENFDFSIADGGVFYPIERFSGGEVDLANFCLRIAITKAIMDLSGAENHLEFLAFDEIFGSQDEERRLEMMLALHYLQEQFRQIYIISHIDSLKDYFPHLLEVQFTEEGSQAIWR